MVHNVRIAMVKSVDKHVFIDAGTQGSHESTVVQPETPGDAVAPLNDRQLSTSSARCKDIGLAAADI